MSTAKQTLKTEPKELNLVCKCGSCTHWKIVLSRSEPQGGEYMRGHEFVVCVKCGDQFSCYFSMGPHEGVHYEKYVKGETDQCDTIAAGKLPT